MDIKDCINSCTKVDKNQCVNNVKWSTVPKDKNQLHRYRKQPPLPYNLELQKSLYDQSIKKHGKRKKRKNKKYNKKDNQFQASEIKESIREVGIGWDVLYAVEKRYKDLQKNYIVAVTDKNNSESNVSFVTAQTTDMTTITNSTSEYSFLSAMPDFKHLKISDENIETEIEDDRNEDKGRYRKNALITTILQAKESNCFLAKCISKDCSIDKNICDSLNEIQSNKTNSDREKTNQCMYEHRILKYFESKNDISKTCQPLKELIQKDSKQKDHQELKEDEIIKTSRKYFMDIPDEYFCKFVRTESMKN